MVAAPIVDSRPTPTYSHPPFPHHPPQGKIGPKAKLSDVVTVLEPKEELDIPVPEPAAVPAAYGAPAAPAPVGTAY